MAGSDVGPFLAHLSAGDGAIDVGANVGVVTAQLARAVGPTGRVLAIEPQDAAADVCVRACAAFPWVDVSRMAVTDTDGRATLHVGPILAHGSLAPENIPDCRGSITVPTLTLAHAAVRVPRLTAIKIDAQGAEGQILAGAGEVLDRAGLWWMVELWPAGLRACGSSLADVIAAFAPRGWSVLAFGKRLESPGMSWARLAETLQPWDRHMHTNVLIGRA